MGRRETAAGMRARRARIKVQQQEMLEEAAMQPAVPEMESLIVQAVADNSRTVELERELVNAKQELLAERRTRLVTQEQIIAAQREHLDTYRKLVLAMEQIDLLKDRNER